MQATRRMIGYSQILLVALMSVLVAGCGGDERAPDNSGEELEQTVEDTQRGGESTESGQEVTLQIEGDSGTAFSGTCSIGDEEEEEIEGQVPESFSYDLEGQQLECEIQKQGTDAGELRVLLIAPGNRIEQQTDSGTINLTFSEDGVVSSSTSSSSTSSNSVNQVISSSTSSQ